MNTSSIVAKAPLVAGSAQKLALQLRWHMFFCLAIAASAAALATQLAATQAHTLGASSQWYVATDGADGADCLSPANACSTIGGAMSKPGFMPADTVLVAAGTYTGTGSEVLLLDKSVYLSGGWTSAFSAQNDVSIIDAQKARRGIYVTAGVTVTLEQMSIRYGSANQGSGIYNSGSLILDRSEIMSNTGDLMSVGGGVASFGTLTITNSVIRNNESYDSAGIENIGTGFIFNSIVDGNFGEDIIGGIENIGRLTIYGSTLSNNQAGIDTAGLQNDARGILTVTNSTISGNQAHYSSGDAMVNWGVTRLDYVTISGGDVVMYSGTLAIHSTVIGGSCRGVMSSRGYNIIQSLNSCSVLDDTTGNRIGVDPLLAPLQDNGGPTGTQRPLLHSPAINAGDPNDCPPTDQRGLPRPQNGVCDSGAVEAPISFAFLPWVARDYCGDFLDDFSTPSSGWPVSDTSLARREYLAGKYRILSKAAGYLFLSGAPDCARYAHSVEVDAQWNGQAGSSYGLVFGITAGFDQFYLFDVNTTSKQYRLLRWKSGGGYTTIVPVTASNAIQSGSTGNHLKAARNPYLNTIDLEVNGVALGRWSESTIGPRTGTGVALSTGEGNPNADVRFDNYRVTVLPDSVAANSAAATQTRPPSVIPANQTQADISSASEIPAWR